MSNKNCITFVNPSVPQTLEMLETYFVPSVIVFTIFVSFCHYLESFCDYLASFHNIHMTTSHNFTSPRSSSSWSFHSSLGTFLGHFRAHLDPVVPSMCRWSPFRGGQAYEPARASPPWRSSSRRSGRACRRGTSRRRRTSWQWCWWPPFVSVGSGCRVGMLASWGSGWWLAYTVWPACSEETTGWTWGEEQIGFMTLGFWNECF